MTLLDSSWPAQVPVLRAKQIHKGTQDGPNDTHCIARWLHLSFRDREPWFGAKDALYTTAKCDALWRWNDSWWRPRWLIARVWNRAMASLGYVRRGDVFVRPDAAKGEQQ